MTISSISRYRGGTVDDVVPLARSLKAIYLRYGVGYRLGRVEGDPNAGDWIVTVTYADAYAKATAEFANDPELQAVFHAIARFAKRISRDAVVDLEV
jgi:hypothetical protein